MSGLVLDPVNGVPGRATLLRAFRGDVTATGSDTVLIDTSGFSGLWIAVYVVGITATPSFQVNYAQVTSGSREIPTLVVGSAITAAAGSTSASSSGTLAAAGRLSWVLTGGTVTGVEIDVIGRR